MTHARIYIRSLLILFSERTLFSALLIAGIAVSIIQIYEPVLFGKVIDNLTHIKVGEQTSLRVLGVWAALGLINVISSVFLAVMTDRLAHRQRLRILGEIFGRVIGLPVTYHAEQGSGRVVRAILTGSDQLFTFWLSFIREHLVSLIGILLLVPLAIKIDYRMASLLGLLATIYAASNFAILRRTHTGQSYVEGYHQDVFGRVGDVIGNVTVVQAYTRLVDETEALQEMMAQLLRAQYPVLTWWGLLSVVTRVASTVTMVSVLALGAVLASRGEISVGEIVAFVGFSGILIARLDQISSFLSRVVTQGPALANFFALFDQKGGAVDLPDAQPMPKIKGDIEFHNVSFLYPEGKQGVYNLNFKSPAGTTTALVGASGSGKSTTLALLQRIFDPETGTISIDGHDIRGFTLSTFREQIATVFQEAGLFNRSIRENILVGRPSATDEEIIEAAKKADAHDFINKKNGGYDFVIGERGSLLSGGERQRVAIARAILKRAPILIFDEATSALDNESEKRVQTAISRLREDSTTFIIAHRLSTVVHADLVLVFDHGKIVEMGSFTELANAGGYFAKLLNAGDLTANQKNSKAALASHDRSEVAQGAI